MMDKDTELDHENRITKLEAVCDELTIKINTILTSSNTTLTLIKWVILPLITILGALVGVKLALPT